jgi:hypothetical protein
MKTFRVYYWIYKNDQYEDFEIDIQGFNFDEAYTKFREINTRGKIRCINEVV